MGLRPFEDEILIRARHAVHQLMTSPREAKDASKRLALLLNLLRVGQMANHQVYVTVRRLERIRNSLKRHAHATHHDRAHQLMQLTDEVIDRLRHRPLTR